MVLGSHLTFPGVTYRGPIVSHVDQPQTGHPEFSTIDHFRMQPSKLVESVDFTGFEEYGGKCRNILHLLRGIYRCAS